MFKPRHLTVSFKKKRESSWKNIGMRQQKPGKETAGLPDRLQYKSTVVWSSKRTDSQYSALFCIVSLDEIVKWNPLSAMQRCLLCVLYWKIYMTASSRYNGAQVVYLSQSPKQDNCLLFKPNNNQQCNQGHTQCSAVVNASVRFPLFSILLNTSMWAAVSKG